MWVEKHGKTWRIRDRIAGELVTLEGGFPTKTSARDAATLLKADSLRGDALLPQGGAITLDQFLDAWWPDYERSLRPTAQDSEGGRMRNHIRPLLGRHRLDEIDASVVRAWVKKLEHGFDGMVGSRRRIPLSPKSVHNCHGLLYRIMQAAITERRLRTNPCAGTPLPARTRKEMKFLSDPEIGRLVAAMPKHWRPLVVLLVSTGLRWGEAIGLRVGRVDLEAKRPFVRVLEHLHELGDGALVWGDPKTAMSRRTVPITARVVELLRPLVEGRPADGLVFLTPTGLTVRTRNFRRIWVKATRAAGLEGLRVHDLRHTHAALLIARGHLMYVIARRLGHSSETITSTLYGHLREEVDDSVLESVDLSLAAVDEALQAEVEDELVGELPLAA